MMIETMYPDVLVLARRSAFRRCLALRKNLLISRCIPSSKLKTEVFSTETATASVVKLSEKPSICTADELHYVAVPNSDWRLALWRYHPSPQAPVKNHPLLLLSGVGTNAIGYDLSPECSFARYMSREGFDTWVLEARGAGLSTEMSTLQDLQTSSYELSEKIVSTNNMKNLNSISEEQSMTTKQFYNKINSTPWDEPKLVSILSDIFMRFSERLYGFLNESHLKIISENLHDQVSRLLDDTRLSGDLDEKRSKLTNLLEPRQNNAITDQIVNLCETVVNAIEGSQRTVSPQLYDMHERLVSTIEDVQKQLELIVKFNWDFDNYLEEDLPAAMYYIRAQSRPSDGKLLAIGHSMGGMLLYSLLTKCALEGREPGLAGIVTLAASLDYTSSKSCLKLILPLADPAQALNVPVVPLGALLAAAYPLSYRPPYVFYWLHDIISAKDMMHPDMIEKLVMNNFCTIPAKLILQLTTAFKEGGLRNRNGSLFYKYHLHKSSTPVLALAADHDLVCPPQAVEETVKLLPSHLVNYKIVGEPDGPHFAHYDLVGGKLAADRVYTHITRFLSDHDLV